jgi:hypothetical protein
LSGRLQFVACRLIRAHGSWRIQVEGVLLARKQDGALAAGSRRFVGSARLPCGDAARTTAEPTERSWQLALASAMADLAERSGRGLQLFRGFRSGSDRHRE